MNQKLSKKIEAYSIRRMQPEDINTVYLLESTIHEFPWTKKIFQDCLKVGYEGFVMEDPYKLMVGYSMTSYAADETHLLNITLKPRIRGQGLGRKFMQHMIVASQQKQAHKMILEVRCSNEIAISLYKKLGFTLLSRRENYYPASNDGREDAWVFALDLIN